MLKLFKRAVVTVALSALVLTFGMAPASADLGLQAATLACNDGTNAPLGLDPLGLTELDSAVAAIDNYPAGDPPVTCDVSETTANPAAPANASGGEDVAVGGGQLLTLLTSCYTGGPGPGQVNFSFSAHVAHGTPVTPGVAQPGAGGTWNATVPESSSMACAGGTQVQQAHLVAKVDCVYVAPGSPPGAAVFTARVTQSNGGTFPVGTEHSISVLDNGTSTGDLYGDNTTDAPCDFDSFYTHTWDQGNIVVHSGA